MDEQTLNELKKAFDAAPSFQLAKVIILASIEKNELSEVDDYLPHLSSDLEASDARIIAQALYDAGQYEQAICILNKEDSNQAIMAVECLLKLNDMQGAKELYQKAIMISPELARQDLNQLFSIDSDKPKLRVVEKKDMASVTDLTRYKADTTDFSDVVGLNVIKKQISKKIILPFQKPSLFSRFRKKIGGGVLLYGPPGCGKTLLARATAGECNASFYNIEISDVLDMYIGESEQKLHAIFEKARAETPSVLFFDELEALAGKREHARNNTTSNTISLFLTELDGFSQNNHGVLVLASTNVPWAIDPAFLRPGRFDRMFFVPPPDRDARKAILEHHMKGRPSESDINYLTIAAKTPGYSGADMANLVEMAADEAIDESIESGNEVNIESKHFKLALKESRQTTTEWLTTARNYARYANDGGRYNDVLDFIKKHEN